MRNSAQNTYNFAQLALACGLLMMSSSSFASAYCSIIDKQKDCQFDTWKACQQAVGNNGVCVINSNEGQASSHTLPDYAIQDQRLQQHIQDGRAAVHGDSAYCVQTLNNLRCHYQDFTSCQNSAIAQGGQCRINPQR